MFLRIYTVASLSLICSVPFCFAADQEEIIVTAERRPQPAAELTASATTIDKQELDTVVPAHPGELLNRVVGVNINRGSGQEHLTAIRSPVLTGGAGAGSFLYLEDHIPLRAAGFANINGLFEANTELAGKIEVLRGPGGVLYGSNALHGMLNIITPDPAAAGSNLSLWGGPQHYVSATGLATTTSGPGDLLLAGHVAHDGGFRADSGYDQQKLLGHYRQRNEWGEIGLKLSWQNLNQETAGYVVGDGAYHNRELSKANADPEAFRDARSLRAVMTLGRKLDADRSLNIDLYARDTGMQFLMHFVPGQALEENGHSSIGILNSLVIEKADYFYRFGFDLEYSSGYLRETQEQETVFSFVQGNHYDYGVTAAVASPYVSADWRLNDQTRLKAGLRYDLTAYDYNNKLTDGVSGRFLRVADREDRFHMLTPGISLLRKFNNSLNGYLRLARGTRAPQTTDLYRLQVNQQPDDIKPETLDLLEAGVKYFNDNVHWNIAVFTMRKNHFFFRDADGFNVTDGKTSHSGIEFEINSKLNSVVYFAADLSYTKHLYEFDRPVTSNSESIHKGDDVDSAPRWLGNVRFGFRSEYNRLLELEWRHMGEYFMDAANSNSYPGHDVWVLRGKWPLRQRYTLHVRIDNLFDTRYAERADFAFGNERYFPGRERAVFAGMSLKF